MEIIVFEKSAYYRMVAELKQTIVEAVKEARTQVKITLPKAQEEWVGSAEAQKILKCKRVRLRRLRENWKIKSTPKGKHFLYLKSSLYDYLNGTTLNE